MKNPTKEPEFKRVLGNLLKSKPKPHSEMKIGKKKATKRQSDGKKHPPGSSKV